LKIAIAILVAGAAIAFFGLGPARIWSVFGPADLGPVTFETLERRTSPNEALACPNGLCKARGDVVPPVFALDAVGLRAAMAKVLATEPKLTRIATDAVSATERYIQRSALLEFPDTIVVRYIEIGNGRSTLAIYSRSQLGHSDMGVNKARIERWLTKLKQAAPVAG
jgi:uncharacterized protein (DUF1499 family)